MSGRRWLKIGGGVGASVASIVGLFALLVTLYGFQIEGTHDYMCDTQFEGFDGSWCDSFINVTNPNVYYVDIYNPDSVRLKFSPQVDEYYLFRKDGRCRGGESCAAPNGLSVPGWNFIDFTPATKPLDDKAYVFRFPARSTKEFRLIGKKPAGVDVLKWDFVLDTQNMDGVLDPIWGNNFTKTDWIPNIMDFAEPSVGSFHSMPLNLTNPTDEVIIMDLTNGQALGVRVDDFENPSTVNLSVPIYVYNHTVPIIENVTVNTTLWNENGSYVEEITEEQITGYDIVGERTRIYSPNYAGVHDFEIIIDNQSIIDNLSIEFAPGESHVFDIRGYVRPGEVFDIIPFGWGGFEYVEAQTWSGENLTTDIQAFYHGGLSGTTVIDESVNGNDGLAVDGVINQSDENGTYYILDGHSGFINSSNYGIPDSADITLTMWIRMNKTSGVPQGMFIGSTGNYAFGAVEDGGNTRMCMEDGYGGLDCTSVGTYTFANQQWMLFTARRYALNDSVDVFINDTLVHTATNDGTKNRDFYITGAPDNTWWLNGSVTGLGIWNRSLTNDEIAYIFEQNRSYDPTDVGTSPVIIINSPANNTDTIDLNPEVNITCTDEDVADENMTFTLEFGSTLYYSGECVNGTPIAVENNSINLTFCTNYTLVANVTDTTAAQGTDTAVGIYVGQTELPTVSLTSPVSGSNTSDQTFNYVFTTIGSAHDFNCTAYANGVSTGTNESVTNGTQTTITSSSVDYGTITAQVNCSNICEFVGASGENNFFLGFSLYGQTLKASGGAEENATVLLINSTSNEVYANFTSDSDGIWVYNLSAEGTWDIAGRPETSNLEGARLIWNFTTP